MSDATWSLVVAPWYDAAILLASVSPVAKRFQWMKTPPPITCVTAIASPIARPRPRMIAAAMPPRAYGNMTPRTISQRVVPSASAPSFSSRGTPRKSSRLMLETIGRIMIVSTTIAVKMLEPVVDGVAEERDEARARCGAPARRGRAGPGRARGCPRAR